MIMNPGTRRVFALVGVTLPLLLLSGLRPVEATCGGGGGGGMGGGSSSSSGTGESGANYAPDWSNSLDDASSKVANSRKGILIYFQPEGAKEIHPFFKTKMIEDISKEHAVVRYAYSKDNPLREEYNVPKDQHALFVCDWFANSMKEFDAPSVKHKFPFPAIEALLKQLRPTVEALLKKMETNLKNGEKKQEDAPECLKALGDLVLLKGHPVVEKAKPLIQKIEAAAEKEIETAVKIEDKKARAKEIQKIKSRYKKLKRVEDRCDKEIEAATGMAPARDADSALARGEVAETVDALLASIDFAKRAPSLSERADQAMREGLRAEIREDYEKALEQYAMAAGLDPRDSTALAYLGELYRHHLGRWDDARKTFERIVELNNHDLAMAVALHGLGKMTIWEGNNEAGLKLFEASLKRRPTAICYRNLAVFWNTEGEFKKAFDYATQAFKLDEGDAYNQVFYAVYLILDGQKEKGETLIKNAQFDPSMAYNYACYHAAAGRDELALKYLHRHFYGYERYDDVRRFEMAEARMDIHFKKYKNDPKFLELTALAAK